MLDFCAVETKNLEKFSLFKKKIYHKINSIIIFEDMIF